MVGLCAIFLETFDEIKGDIFRKVRIDVHAHMFCFDDLPVRLLTSESEAPACRRDLGGLHTDVTTMSVTIRPNTPYS